MKRFSRREWLRQWLSRREATGVVAESELRRLRAALLAAMTPGSGRRAPPLLRLAEELHHLGAAVQIGDFSGGAEDRLFSLASLAALAAELRQAQAQLAAGQQAGDIAAVARLRQAARRARARALRVANHRRAQPQKRAAAQEMADWLLLWLEMPEAFFEWLELRQRTIEYIALCKSS